MRNEFAIRFKPRNGGSLVPARAYVAATGAIFTGLESLRTLLAPLLAAERSWTKLQVLEALELAVGPHAKGSLVIPVQCLHGDHLDASVLEDMFWRRIAATLEEAISGASKLVELPASIANHFAAGASAANDVGVQVTLSTRNTASAKWADLVDLSELREPLAEYARRRAQELATSTQIIGKIVGLDYDPPKIKVLTAGGRIFVDVPAALRRTAHEYWGQEVIIDATAAVTSDGQLRHHKAYNIAPVKTASGLTAAFRQTFGTLKDAWNTEEANSHFDSLRTKN